MDLPDAFGADAVNLSQPLAVVLDDVKGVHAELGDDEFGEFWSDALDKSAAEVLLQSEECDGHGFLVALHDKLPAVLTVDFPLSVRDEHSAYGDVEHVADEGDEVVIPLHPCLQYRIAVLAILIRNPFYDCPQLHNNFTKVHKLLGIQENNCTFVVVIVNSNQQLTRKKKKLPEKSGMAFLNG